MNTKSTVSGAKSTPFITNPRRVNNVHFKDRAEAGQKLAEKLEKYRDKEAVIYALPRGGVVLGYEIAKRLNAPLDLIITRKIGHPNNPEYAICAIAEDGHKLCNEEERSHIDSRWFDEKAKDEQEEAKRRRELYLQGKSESVKGKIAIIVDDGVATGLTLRLAIKELKHKQPKRIVVAVPVAPKEIASELEKEVDEFVALDIPKFYLGAVGAYYENFSQVKDEEVIQLLEALD